MTLTFPALLLLQTAPTGGTNPLVPLLVQMGAIFAIFYFLMIRPQQKQRRLHEERLRNLKKGDSIVTAGGIVGDVVHIREAVADDAKKKSMDDHVTIKSGESRFIVERGRITRVSGTDGTADPSK
jgi:preprotein translocase subunit YajC